MRLRLATEAALLEAVWLALALVLFRDALSIDSVRSPTSPIRVEPAVALTEAF